MTGVGLKRKVYTIPEKPKTSAGIVLWYRTHDIESSTSRLQRDAGSLIIYLLRHDSLPCFFLKGMMIVAWS
jgi:hypothetical protein